MEKKIMMRDERIRQLNQENSDLKEIVYKQN